MVYRTANVPNFMWICILWPNVDMFRWKERPRTEYANKCTTTEVNPVTGIEEPHFPQELRTPRLISGYAVIILMVNLTTIVKNVDFENNIKTHILYFSK